jgi:hypothetical protein
MVILLNLSNSIFKICRFIILLIAQKSFFLAEIRYLFIFSILNSEFLTIKHYNLCHILQHKSTTYNLFFTLGKICRNQINQCELTIFCLFYN